MRSAASWLALAIALVAIAGCSIDHRSSDFACQRQSDCSRGRSCIDGSCVLPDDGGVDGPRPGDASVCPSACTSCNAAQKTCTIDCAITGGCGSAIACPAGWNCDLLCSTPNACRNGVACENAASCTITCSGFRSCQNIACGSGRCSVACTGSGSCRDVQCGASCACDVTCQGSALCDPLACTPSCNAVAPLRGCSSLSAGCNTCR